jgi:hypothetical protein
MHMQECTSRKVPFISTLDETSKWNYNPARPTTIEDSDACPSQ